MISASDVERYGYCPLSWYLERKGLDQPSEETKKGIEKHKEVGVTAGRVMVAEGQATDARQLLRVLAIVGLITAIHALAYVIPQGQRWYIGFVMMVIGIVWSMMALYYLILESDRKKAKDVIRLLSISSLVVFAAGLVNLYSSKYDTIVMFQYESTNFIPLIITLLLLLVVALYLYKLWNAVDTATGLRTKEELPSGKIRYTDDMKGARLLISKTYMLSGRPDMIVERDGQLIPVEIKTGRVPRGPFFSHILQIAVYCLILEDTRSRPPYGLIRYREKEFKIVFDDDLRDLVLEKTDLMRSQIKSGVVHRNHHRPGKCHNCSRRENCPERLE